MKINFIGHGLNGYNETVGDYLCSSLRDGSYSSFIAFSAFTKMSAFNILKEDLLNAHAKGKKIVFYLGIVPKGTSKEALEFLIENNIECYTYCNDNYIFHPKIYKFEGNEKTRAIIGSSNLTSNGLFKNVEASVRIDFLNGDPAGISFKNQFESYFKSILDGSENHTRKLTTELLEEFIKSELVVEEKWTTNDNDIAKGNKKFTSKRAKRILKEELGNIDEEKFVLNSSNYRYKVTAEYRETWFSYFEKYKQYIIDNKTVVVKRNPGISGLYTWYRKQKIFYASKEIPNEHKTLLEKIDFPFEDAHNIEWDRAWDVKYKELVEYHNKTGLSWIKRIRDKRNPLKTLSDWCALQRSYNNQSKLSDYRVDKLDEINFPWAIPNFGGLRDDETWFERYLELEQFKKKNGHCHPPQVNPDGTLSKFGKWVNEQMTLKNTGRKHPKTGERVYIVPIREELLTELGLDWNHELNKHKKSFNEQVNSFIAYRKLHPDLKPPKGKFKKERDWLSQMKHKFDKLPEWKRKILLDEQIILND